MNGRSATPCDGSASASLAAETVRAVDRTRLIDDVLMLGHQLEDALWRADAAKLGDLAASRLVVCGMGGSAIGGDLAAAILGERLRRPLTVVRSYDPGPWLAPDALVLCSSYSGQTEETLACFERALAAGCRLVVATTGGELALRARRAGAPVIGIPAGLEPRCAVAYVTTAALACAEAAAVAPSVRAELEDAARTLTELAASWGPEAAMDAEPKLLARMLHRRVPVFHGAGATAAAARRFKTQWNENPELPAFWSELPEQNHNEICGWGDEAAAAALVPVLLDAPSVEERLRRRLERVRVLLEQRGFAPLTFVGRGETVAEQVLSLVLLGDLASVYAAVLAGRDPRPVAAIKELKEQLS
ncbi:SIS domain-containing protein [Thermoleophilum album]|uniref:Glucose/mannose-6-phosphate isomerase n=1 Tax=Thermoleophilum album TaxID=29539 RepID=A0A1H6FK97_THEAL|nr:SIS domain-containing protein [Thermoleophilum album]SEH10255.1 glucose/mannose-6-phosphate isomerase [Thermoleophilum album]